MKHNYLDITQDKRDLEQKINILERQLVSHLEQIERLKSDLRIFQQEYDIKVRSLYMKLDEIEYELFKYYHIGEVVGDDFSFSDAQEVFEDTMKSRRAEMADEYEKLKQEKMQIDKLKSMTVKDKQDLKNLYRKLAHLFHPDIIGGNAEIMISINRAYAEGDIQSLREIELHNIIVNRTSTTIEDLKLRQSNLDQLILNAKSEMHILRKSDSFVMRRNFLKSGSDYHSALSILAQKIMKDIEKKADQLKELKKKFEVEENQSAVPV